MGTDLVYSTAFGLLILSGILCNVSDLDVQTAIYSSENTRELYLYTGKIQDSNHLLTVGAWGRIMLRYTPQRHRPSYMD